MNESKDGVLVTLLKAAAAVAPVLVFPYLEEPRFRWAVDAWLAQLDYRRRLGAWKARAWGRWAGWQREAYEQAHGPLEG